MVKGIRTFALACLLATGFAPAGETGSFANRAQKLLANGQYSDALRMLHSALQASAKEADLVGEQRIRIDIAQILLHHQEYGLADSLLASVPEAKLDARARLTFIRLRISMYNQQQQYVEAARYFEEHRALLNDDIPEGLHAAILLEGAVAEVGNKSAGSLDTLWDEVDDLLDDDGPGMTAYAKARIADLSGSQDEALKQYNTALGCAQKSLHSWLAGQILYRLGEITKDTTESAAYYLRAAKLFLQLGLDRPFVASAEHYQALAQDDKELAVALDQARERLNARQ